MVAVITVAEARITGFELDGNDEIDEKESGRRSPSGGRSNAREPPSPAAFDIERLYEERDIIWPTSRWTGASRRRLDGREVRIQEGER